MQDFHSIPGLPGRIFGGGSANGAAGGGGADLRRLRGYPGAGTSAAQQLPVKCPRCDSTNTKFCYYNNYNLSQPRHFCKSCRRYWTKGGVLRNVPVGGGCRKSKRSSSSSSKPSSKSSGDKGHHHGLSSASRSSSDCSSLAATTSNPSFPNLSTSLLPPQASNSPPNPPVDPLLVVDAPPLYPALDIFSEPSPAGSFTGVMETATTTPAILGFGFSDTSSIRFPTQLQKSLEEEVRGLVQPGLMDPSDPTVPVDLLPIRVGDDSVGLAATATLDWSGSVDPALFDLAGAVDPATAYWSQSHWSDTDPSVYLP